MQVSVELRFHWQRLEQIALVKLLARSIAKQHALAAHVLGLATGNTDHLQHVRDGILNVAMFLRGEKET